MPTVRHHYRSHSLESDRWDAYRPRDGDVIVVSSYKSGTTWVQTIALRLVAPELDDPAVTEVSPWLESPTAPLGAVVEALDRQNHRRVVKTHLPLDGLPHFPHVRYVVVCRDARDVFMSLWNHYRNLIRYPRLAAPNHPDRVGPPLPRCPTDIRQFWRDWITRGWFEWEREGYPFWSNLRHTRTWWEWRHLQNVRFVHYNDLLTRPLEEIAGLAQYLDVDTDRDEVARIAESVTFRAMRERAERLLPVGHALFRGGPSVFFHKGVNGRWRDVLSSEDQALYLEAARRELPDECRRWLERGGATDGGEASD